MRVPAHVASCCGGLVAYDTKSPQQAPDREAVESVEFVTDHARHGDVPGVFVTSSRRSSPDPRPLPTDPAIPATATACQGRGRDGRVPCPSLQRLSGAPPTYTPSGTTTAVQLGQRRAAIEIAVVHSGQGRVFGETPFSSW